MEHTSGNTALFNMCNMLGISQDRNGPETMESFRSTNINNHYLSKPIYRIGPCLWDLQGKAVNVYRRSRSTFNRAS